MARELSVDADAWEDHARWWDGESRRAVEAMDVSEETLAAPAARSASWAPRRWVRPCRGVDGPPRGRPAAGATPRAWPSTSVAMFRATPTSRPRRPGHCRLIRLRLLRSPWLPI